MRIQLLLKVAGFTVLVPGTVVGLIPYMLLRHSGSVAWPLPSVLSVIAAIVGLGGVGLLAHCLWEFAARGHGTPAPIDPPKVLVVQGIYRCTRNPMYVGILAVLYSEAVLFRSTAILVYACVVFAGFHVFVMLYEEPHLRRRFGQAYEEYCRAVPRWGFAWRGFPGTGT